MLHNLFAMKMTHGSLFAGIDGFSEGAKRAGGIDTVFAVEINAYRRAVVKKKYPKIHLHDDITTFNGHQWKGHIDILTGGFPCQDISKAGKGVGIRGSQSSLWGQYARIIGEILPRYAVIENSPLLLKRGFEQVLCDLSEIGYDAQWECISAEAFGMPHQRERLFVIAYPNQEHSQHGLYSEPEDGKEIFLPMEAVDQTLALLRDPFNEFGKRVGQSAIRRVDDGFPGRPQLIDRLEALGDSASPVICEYLFYCIKVHYQKNCLG